MPLCITRNSILRSRLAPPSACGVFLVLAVSAQTVTVYSELTRIDPLGNPVRADRGAYPPREILSPAIPRNATSSFHMVVEGQPGQAYTFQVVQNRSEEHTSETPVTP